MPGTPRYRTHTVREPSFAGSSTEVVFEFALAHGDAHGARRIRLRYARQELAADLRQDCVGENRVDHAAAAFRLGAAGRDEPHDVVVVLQRDAVMVAHARSDA